MSRSAVHESHHRRGMVLGFTLAETLLLLLFLLLLALGAEIIKQRKELETTPDQDRAERQRLSAQMKQIAPILQEASQIDPNDAPEILRRGLEFVRKFGANVRPDDLQPANAGLTAIVNDALKIDPNGPPERLIRRGLEILKKVGLDARPDQVQHITLEMAKLLEKARQISPQDSTAVLEQALDIVGSMDPPKGKHDWPPIISLSEADGYFFESGSADLSPEFQNTLSRTVIERLLQIVRQYDVNVIEVVGHTDEQPLAGRPSNLDKLIFPFLQGQLSEKFVPSDNAGLGFARAVAVLRFLREDRRLSDLRIIPLSAAQLTDLGDQLSTGDKGYAVERRRRIEIRVRRSDRTAAQEAPDLPAQPPQPSDPIPPKEIPSETPRQSDRLRSTVPRPWETRCLGIEQWSEHCR